MLFGPINPGLLIQINSVILGKSLLRPVHHDRLSQDVTPQLRRSHQQPPEAASLYTLTMAFCGSGHM